MGSLYRRILSRKIRRKAWWNACLKSRENLYVPPASKLNDKLESYNVCMIKMLASNDIQGRDLDLLAYSNIMFLLEAYNMKQLDPENIEMH